jgi:hypothetical protein
MALIVTSIIAVTFIVVTEKARNTTSAQSKVISEQREQINKLVDTLQMQREAIAKQGQAIEILTTTLETQREALQRMGQWTGKN